MKSEAVSKHATVDCDALLTAVKTRLRLSVGGRLAATSKRQADDSAVVVQTNVLACVAALDRLQAVLKGQFDRHERNEREMLDVHAALTLTRNELVGTQAGERRARHMASHDAMTSLPNGGLFRERLDDLLAHLEPERKGPAVLYLDLDGFKAINDAHGHATGDELLGIVAARLTRAVRSEDVVSRLGGDEFACLLPDGLSREQLIQVAQKLFDAVSAPAKIGTLTVTVRPSIGIAAFPADGASAEALLESARRRDVLGQTASEWPRVLRSTSRPLGPALSRRNDYTLPVDAHAPARRHAGGCAQRAALEVCMEEAPDPRRNQLLAALPEAEWARWLPRLEAVDLPLGKVLYESGSTLSHVYFPTTAIVSLLYVLEDGASAEIAVVGNEGIVGISLFMGGASTPSRGVVQSAGQGFRLNASLMLEEFNRAGPVLHLLLRYTQALITQMAQTAVCNRHHSLDQQLCRWLLLSLDRLKSNDLVMTQELIANMLGVRREGVTEAAGKLQDAGLIRYRRGHIKVLDREGLEQRSCECYAVVKTEYDRLLPATMAT